MGVVRKLEAIHFFHFFLYILNARVTFRKTHTRERKTSMEEKNGQEPGVGGVPVPSLTQAHRVAINRSPWVLCQVRLGLAESYHLNKELVRGTEVMPGPHPSGKSSWSLCFPPECLEWGPAPLCFPTLCWQNRTSMCGLTWHATLGFLSTYFKKMYVNFSGYEIPPSPTENLERSNTAR